MNKLLKTLIASVLLCSVSLLGVFASSCKKTNAELPKIEEDVLTKIESGVTDGDGNKLEEDEVYAMPRNMVFSAPATLSDEGISEQSLTSVTVTATLEPVGANEPVDWSVKFKDATSSWAQGKTVTDYVTVTPTSDGGTVATVKNKAAFGEQIILTCAARNNSAVNATCTLDYYAKISSDFYVEVAYGDNTREDNDLYISFGKLIENDVAFEKIGDYPEDNPYKLPAYGYLYGLTFQMHGIAGVGTIVEDINLGFYQNDQGYNLGNLLGSVTSNPNTLFTKADEDVPNVFALYGLFDYTFAIQYGYQTESDYNQLVDSFNSLREPTNANYIPHLCEIYFYTVRNGQSVVLDTFYFAGPPEWSAEWIKIYEESLG